MDGLGLYDKLSRELQLNLALKRKMRRVAETGCRQTGSALTLSR